MSIRPRAELPVEIASALARIEAGEIDGLAGPIANDLIEMGLAAHRGPGLRLTVAGAYRLHHLHYPGDSQLPL